MSVESPRFESKRLGGEVTATRIATPIPTYTIENIRDNYGGPSRLTVLSTNQFDGYLEMTNPQTEALIEIGFADTKGAPTVGSIISDRLRRLAQDMYETDGNGSYGFFDLPNWPALGTRRIRGMKIAVDGQSIKVDDILGEQGHGSKMTLFAYQGNVTLTLSELGQRPLEMEFTPMQGGTMFPCIQHHLVGIAMSLAALEDF